MSRTYAHQPLWCRINDHSVCVAVHDHRTSMCDIDVDHPAACHWEYDWLRQPPMCACGLCRGWGEQHRTTRRRRRHVRLELHRQRSVAASERDTLDVPPVR